MGLHLFFFLIFQGLRLFQTLEYSATDLMLEDVKNDLRKEAIEIITLYYLINYFTVPRL